MNILDDLQRKEITVKGKNDEQRDARSIQIERLLGCAYRAYLFQTAEGSPLALIPGEGINQSDVAPLHSREFATFLREQYHAQYGHFPREAVIRIVRDLLDRRTSRRTALSPPVAPRVVRGEAEQSDEPGPRVVRDVLALDLGRRSPAAPDSVLEIDVEGWSVKQNSGFAFVRARGHRALPLPEAAGPQALNELKDLLRVDDYDWLKILTWLLAAMRPSGPYPILVLQGEAGSGKSVAAKMLKSLLDPAAVPFVPLSSNPNTLLRQANQSWIQAYDHVTAMPQQVSAALCRLSTGAALKVAVDGSPMTLSLARPILLTVPSSVSGADWKPRGDLLARMLTVTLPPLPAETTRPEWEIAARFAKAHPQMLGALAQAVSVGMARVDQVELAGYPRHAEAAAWAIAASPALSITEESLQQALEPKIQFQLRTDPLVQKLATLMATRESWQGNATQLKLELDLAAAPNHLSRKLKNVTPMLRDQGIDIAFPPRQENGRLICITHVHKEVGSSSQSGADLSVDSVVGIVAPITVLAKIDRQIVSAEQNQGMRQPTRPGAPADPPLESGTTDPKPAEGTIQAAPFGGGVIARATVSAIAVGRPLECAAVPPRSGPPESMPEVAPVLPDHHTDSGQLAFLISAIGEERTGSPPI